MTPDSEKDRVLTIYKASAGSGKTYTLAYQYLVALLTVKNPDTGKYSLNDPSKLPNRHRGILAITFTNKATEEMKSRITSRLDDLTRLRNPGEEEAEYAQSLMNLTGCSREQLAETAKAALHQLLHDFHNFNVSTIDSFFQRVLRNFARELDRQGDFEIELDSHSAMNAAVDLMLDDFNLSADDKKPLEDWLLHFMKSAVNTGTKANILDRNSGAHTSLVKLITTITSEKFLPYEKKMKEYFNSPDGKLSTLIEELDKLIPKLEQKSADIALDILTSLGSDSGIGANPSKFLSKLKQKADIEIEKLKTYFNNAAETIENPESNKIFKKSSKCDADLKIETASRMQESILLRLKVLELKLILSGLHTLSFLSFAWGYLDKLCSDNNLVLLSNTNSLISRIIDGSDVPFIYERMGVRLHHFLIDEFQDTSVKQWDNLIPLVANSIAEKHDNLIIGDVKQSIYRFRNSEPDLLHQRVQKDDFPDYSNVRGDKPEENTNYRSSVEVIQFNNTLFSRLASEIGAPGYDHVVQAVSPKHENFHGYVHLFPYHVESERGRTADTPEKPLTEEEAFLKNYPQLRTMVEEIQRETTKGPYKFKDIAILCDRRSECATVVDYLLNYHSEIPVITSEALYLTDSVIVKRIISILRMIANVESARADAGKTGGKYSTLADMYLAMSRYEYFVSNPSEPLNPESALSRALSAEENTADVVNDILASNPSSLTALLDVIISKHIPPEMRKRELPYLTAFMDYVAEYSERGLQSVNSFLHWWDEHSTDFSVPLGNEIDAVTVLTIHKSKGLEFPCVHIPFGSWPLVKRKYKTAPQWVEMQMPKIEGIDPEIKGVDKKLLPPAILVNASQFGVWGESIFFKAYDKYIKEGEADTVNLTYVAYTRAEAELLIYYDPKKDIGEYLDKCLSAVQSEEEKKTDGTIDLAKNFNAETKEFKLGEATVKDDKGKTDGKDEEPLPDEKDEKPKEEEAKKEDKSRVYEPDFDVFLRKDTSVVTTLDSGLDVEPDAPSAPTKEGIGEESQVERYGNMMHEILANTRRYTDIDNAVALVAASGQYNPQEVKKGGTRLKEVLEKGVLDMNQPELARWFRDYKTVLCEQSIYNPDADPKEASKRPDRLVIHADGSVEIVDFKFTSEKEPGHILQVWDYVKLLRSMGKNVTGAYLWYPLHNDSPIVPCPL